jgi:uncharacterized protein YunC (DUF1805 family)
LDESSILRLEREEGVMDCGSLSREIRRFVLVTVVVVVVGGVETEE